MEDVFGGYKIIEQKLGILPLSLPYKTNSVLAEMNMIPAEQSDQVVFSIKGADPFNLNFFGKNDFDYSLKTSQLYGKRITLSWAAATAEDEAIINRYGSIFGVPAYLVQMKPQLKIDGVVAAEGKAIGLGYRQEFTMNMKSTGIPESKVVNPVTAGSYYCVGLDYQSISQAEIENSAKRLNQYKDTANAQNVYTDEILGELLNGETYFAQLDIYNKLMAQKYGIKSTRLVSEAITGYGSRVKYMFSCPVEVAEGSFFIDVDHDVFGLASLDGDNKDERAYMLVSGAMGSYMEHAIWEQLSGSPSVSAMKILSEANARGVPVYTINQENSSKILPQLQVSSSVKRDIQNAVAAGKVVIIPQKELRYYDWQGSGYIILDTETGAAGYMISGGLAGGSDGLIKDLVILAGLIAAVIILFQAIVILTEYICIASIAGVVVSGIFFIDLLHAALNYSTGDEQAGNEAYRLAKLTVVFLLVGPLLAKALAPLMEKFAGTPFGKIIFTSLYNPEKAIVGRMLGTGYSEEFIQNIIRISGKQSLTATEKIIGQLEGMNVSRTLIEATGNSLGYEGLAAAKALLQAGKATESELLILVNAGYNLDDILVLANHNILPSRLAQYGITNSLEAGFASKLVKAGYSLEVIAELSQYGIKPSSYLSRGITTPELAETVAEAIELIPVQFRQMVLRAFKDAPKARTLTSDIIVYRHWGGIAEETGSPWYSLERFSPTEARVKLALPDGNTAVNVTSFTIPTGTKVVQG